MSEQAVASTISDFLKDFPPGCVTLESLQLTLNGVPQHYLIATSPDALYVAFMGTKQWQDLVCDASVLHSPVWAESARLAADQQSIPAAHRGFLERARTIHVEQLYELAASRGLRLVLCGHSLGGSVAKLCTLRLLRELPDWPRPRIRCVSFATPAVGNAALAELVENAGWASHFATYYLPEDQAMQLLSVAKTDLFTETCNVASSGSGAAASSGTAARGRFAVNAARPKAQAPAPSPALAQLHFQQSPPPSPAPSSLPRSASCASLTRQGSSSSLGSLATHGSALSLASLASSSASGSSDAILTPGAAGPLDSLSPSPRGAMPLDGSRPASVCGLPLSPLKRSASAADIVACAAAAAGLQPPTHMAPSADSLDEERACTAMEEILSPGPDQMDAAVAAGAAGGQAACGGGGGGVTARAARGGSWGLRLALERRRATRRARQFAARAHIPLPKALVPLPKYHAFGEQWYITEEGVFSPEELQERRAREKAQRARDGKDKEEKEKEKAGFFHHHRMCTYRARNLSLINRTLAGIDLATKPMPDVAARAPTAVAVRLQDAIIPRIAVHRATLRGLMPDSGLDAPAPGAQLPQAGAGQVQGSPAQPPAWGPWGWGAPGRAASAPPDAPGVMPPADSRAPVRDSAQPRPEAATAEGSPATAPGLFGWVRGAGAGASAADPPRRRNSNGQASGKAAQDSLVKLDLEVEGHNLQYCRKVAVTLVRPPAAAASGPGGAASSQPSAPSAEADVPCEVVQVLYAQPYNAVEASPPLQPVSLLRNTLHSVLHRYWQHGSTAGSAAAAVAAAAVAAATGAAGATARRLPGWGRRFRLPLNASSSASHSAAGAQLDGASDSEDDFYDACDADSSATDVSSTAAAPSRLVLRVSLPRALAQGLLDGSLPGARLQVSVRSDFHEVTAVPVAVRRLRVAILGTSAYAASLVQAALAAPAALAAAGLGAGHAAPTGPGVMGGRGGGAAWLPPQLVKVFTAVRGGGGGGGGGGAPVPAAAVMELPPAARVEGVAAAPLDPNRVAAAAAAVAAAASVAEARVHGGLEPGLGPLQSLQRPLALRWSLRQSLAAAAVGLATALAAGATGGAAAAGAAAAVSSAVGLVASNSDGGTTAVVGNAAFSAAAAAAAAAAATATAVADDGAALAAAAAAAAMAAVASPLMVNAPVPSLPVGSNIVKAATVSTAMPSLTAPSLKPGLPSHAPGPRPGGSSGGSRRTLAPPPVASAPPLRSVEGEAPAATPSAASLSRPRVPTAGSYTAAAPPPPPPPPRPAPQPARWVLRFNRSSAAGGPRPGGGVPGRSGAAGPGTGLIQPLPRGWSLWWRSAEPGADGAAGSVPPSAGSPASAARSPGAGWLSWGGGSAVPRPRLLTAPPPGAAAGPEPASPAAVRGWWPRPRAAMGRSAGAGAGPVSAPLSQLRQRLLGGLRPGPGRAVLPLPPAVAAEGLEFCNVMVTPRPPAPARPAWAPRLVPLPLQRQPAAATAVAVEAAAMESPAAVPAAALWPGRLAAAAEPPSLAEAAAGAAAAAAAAAGGSEVMGLAPLVAWRRVVDGLQRQVLTRGWWWRWLLGGVLAALLQPVALVGSLGRQLPVWTMLRRAIRRGRRVLQRLQRQAPQPSLRRDPSFAATCPGGAGSTAPGGPHDVASAAAAAAAASAAAAPPGWEAVVVVASCRDALRVLRTRDMERLRAEAAGASCGLVPVLLASKETPPARRAAALRALAGACGCEAERVAVVELDAWLLDQPAAAIPAADLEAVMRAAAEAPGAEALRRAVRRAAAAAAAGPAAVQPGQGGEQSAGVVAACPTEGAAEALAAMWVRAAAVANEVGAAVSSAAAAGGVGAPNSFALGASTLAQQAQRQQQQCCVRSHPLFGPGRS
ncbi:hypothetical protein HYH03_000459 [Edaphochlamys debaryana]|uniref:Fungal lipase-type domain-containing protein n=1 Tax=Edaphochlamys debaryana TaxID=47281 RepID=A0A835YG68_9CHLO|nr:hypothetical protein HYH03_000459 [Edaphochlamys debaryana]|eukprot:KAG2501961.1 hypothetical protein HYH03_000459 [Edaphochlamys debaryana]